MTKQLMQIEGDDGLIAVFAVDEASGDMIEVTDASERERAALMADIDRQAPKWIDTIRALEDLAEVRKQRKQREAKAQSTLTLMAERLRYWLRDCMLAQGRDKVQTDAGTASVPKLASNRKRKLDIRVPLELLPEKYVRKEVKLYPDEEAILADIDAGVEIPDVSVMEPERSLVLR